jgi:hypothetical protein
MKYKKNMKRSKKIYLFIIILILTVYVIYVALHFVPIRISSFQFWQSGDKKLPEYVKSVDFVCSKLNLNSNNQIMDAKYFIPNVKFILYVISHDDKSFQLASDWSKCMPWAKVINITSTIFFESIIYQQNLPMLEEEWIQYDFIGIATYKSVQHFTIEKLKMSLELLSSSANIYDVIPLMLSGEYLLEQGIKGHTKEFKFVWETFLHTYGYDYNRIEQLYHIEAFWRNTFLIKKIWLQKLILSMNKAMNIALYQHSINQLLHRHVLYNEQKKDIAKKIFQHENYAWFPFIFERLPCFFLHEQNAKIYSTIREISYFENNNFSVSSSSMINSNKNNKQKFKKKNINNNEEWIINFKNRIIKNETIDCKSLLKEKKKIMKKK